MLKGPERSIPCLYLIPIIGKPANALPQPILPLEEGRAHVTPRVLSRLRLAGGAFLGHDPQCLPMRRHWDEGRRSAPRQ